MTAPFLLLPALLTASPGAGSEAIEPSKADLPRTADEPAPLLRRWSAPGECISEEQLRKDIKQASEASAFLRHIEGEMVKTDKGYTVVLKIYEEGRFLGKRVLEFEESACRDHDEAITLVSTLLLEHGPPETAQPEQESPSSEPPSPPPSKPAEVLRERPRPTTRESQWRLGLAPALLGGGTPPWRLAVQAHAGWRAWPWLWLEAQGQWHIPQTTERPEGGLRARGGRAELRACTELGQELSGGVCLGAGWFGTVATGFEVLEPETTPLHSFAASASGNLTISVIPGLGLRAEAGIVTPLRRPSFVLQGPGEDVQVYETQPIILSTSVGIVASFE